MKEVRFTATDDEYAEILAYVEGKRRWRKMGHFVRYAVFKEMDYNRSGRHDKPVGAARAEATGRQRNASSGFKGRQALTEKQRDILRARGFKKSTSERGVDAPAGQGSAAGKAIASEPVPQDPQDHPEHDRHENAALYEKVDNGGGTP